MTTPQHFDRSRLEILGPAECLRLLRSVPLGRLVYTNGGLPAIRLVNFVLDDDTIVFSTAQGDKFRAAERGDVVAFEADEVDTERHTGWTVTAIGHLSVVTRDESERLHRTLALHSWMPMDDPHLVRLGIESVHGRRLVPWGQRPRWAGGQNSRTERPATAGPDASAPEPASSAGWSSEAQGRSRS